MKTSGVKETIILYLSVLANAASLLYFAQGKPISAAMVFVTLYIIVEAIEDGQS